MKNCLYRIASTLAGLETGWFLAWKLPLPDLAQFSDYSTRRPQSTGGQARHGYNRATLFWNYLTSEQAYIIRDMIDTLETANGIGAATLYLTLPRTDGTKPGGGYIDVSGLALMPEWSPVRDGHGILFENVELVLNNVTVETDPSSAE